LRSKLRQQQQKRKQAIDKYNREVRAYNRKAKQAVNKYNQEVRAYNARVRANRRRLRSLVTRLNQQKTTTRFVEYRTSVQTLTESYTRLDSRSESNQLDPRYNWVLDLSERETANSVDVANRLLDAEPDPDEHVDELQDAQLGQQLREISPDLDDRWQGAVYSLDPKNPDAARHFCTSAREIFTQILEIKAPDDLVFAALPDCAATDRGNPTRRSKIKYFLHRKGMLEEALEDFIEKDMQNIVELFHVFNDGTHGSAGTYDFTQLSAIKKRVEDGIVFLSEIVKDG
jgi:hypothetical protein